MRAPLIVVARPGVDLGPRILDRRELIDVQALVPPPGVERFDARILDRLPRPDEGELYAETIRPVLGGPRLTRGAVAVGSIEVFEIYGPGGWRWA